MALLVKEVNLDEEEEEEVENGLDTLTVAAVPVLTHLAPEQAARILQISKEAPSLLAASPRKTTLVEHVIRLKDGQPIRQRPYRVPQQLVEELQKEVEEMRKLGVIEPSNSEHITHSATKQFCDRTIPMGPQVGATQRGRERFQCDKPFGDTRRCDKA